VIPTTTETTTSRKPRGESLEQTALMASLANDGATVVLQATDEAIADWEASAPRRERELLAAREAREDSLAEDVAEAAFLWLAVHGFYRRGKRKYSGEQVLAAVDFYLDSKQASVADELFQGLRSGKLTVKQAQLLGERELLKAHLNAAMAAKGGRAQLTLADAQRIAEYLQSEFGFWAQRMKKISEGAPLDGRVLQSFRAYFSAAATTYQKFEGLEMEKRGFDLWKNRLADGLHHCEPKGGRVSCPQLTRMGFIPRASRVLRGARACWWRCHCGDIYKNSATGEIRG
jgi:hypothetical protein